MPTPYRIEIYNRNFTLDTWALCNQPNYTFDYLTLEEWSVTAIGTLNPKRGNYVQVIEGNVVKYQGVLTNSETGTEEGLTTLYVRPLQSLLDFDVYLPTIQSNSYIEYLLSNFIYWGRRDNPEPSANLKGLVVATTTSTAGSILVEEDNIVNLWTCAVQALKNHRIVIRASLLTAQRQIRFEIARNTAEARIETDLPNVLSKTFSLQENNGNPNCCLIANEENPSEYLWFSNNTGNNGIWKVEKIRIKDDEDFDTKAAEKALQIITPTEFDNCIEVTVQKDDKIVMIEDIGTLVDIVTEGRIIPSVLTAISTDSSIKTLTFGAIRLDLTRQLILQRRKIL